MARLSLFQRWRSAKETEHDEVPVHIGGMSLTDAAHNQVEVSGVDRQLLGVVAALLLFGTVMVYSASIAMPDNPRFAKLSDLHFLTRHIFSVLIAAFAASLVFYVPMKVWEKWARHFVVVAIVLLVLVLIPGIGIEANGARRWLGLGFMNFQPSELAKLAITVYAADYVVRRMNVVQEKFWHAVWPMAVAVGLMGALLLREPDMGAFLVIAVIAVSVLFIGGLDARWFFLTVAVLVLVFAAIVMTSEWRRERIFAYLNPWSEAYVLGKGYQLTHALIAFGRGQILGVGIGASVEKLHWLPEAHTDFLFAVIGEELGLVGVLSLMAVYFWLIRRIMRIGREALLLNRPFNGLVAQGLGVWLGFQTLINMGVNLGALPTKGLTLPLLSYGGSAMLLNVVALAMVLRIDLENKRMMRGGVA
jgi:cell division protein FtsW